MLLKAHKVSRYESIIAIKMRIIVKPITFDTSAPRYLPIEYKKARSLPYAPTREFGACAGTVGGVRSRRPARDRQKSMRDEERSKKLRRYIPNSLDVPTLGEW